MADKLALYREALRHLGAERLASLTENRPERITLDDVWESAVRFVLTKAGWNFASRTVEITYDEDIEAKFGYSYGFTKPSDCLRVTGLSLDGTFNDGFEEFKDENGVIYANIESFHLQYVSSDENYGMNLGLWSEQFSKAIAAYLAYESGLPISGDRGTRADMFQLYQKLMRDAKAMDASEDRVRRPPVGRLVKARFRGRVNGTDRGL